MNNSTESDNPNIFNPDIFNIFFSPEQLPFQLFCKLREAGFPLQIQEYQDLLEILSPTNIAHLNLKTNNHQELYSLCQSLWVKSRAEKQIFQQICQQLTPQLITAQPKDQPTDQNTDQKIYTTQEITTETPTSQEISVNPLTNTNTSPVLELSPSPIEKPPDFSYIPRLKPPSATSDDKPNRFRIQPSYAKYQPIDYLPMQQTWHQLNYQYLSQIKTEIDLPTTIDDINRHANLFDIHLKPPELPKTQLILLIDRQGSMMPFSPLEKQLTQTIITSGRLNQLTIYYFINSPAYLYLDPDCQKNINLSQVLLNAHSTHTLLLIFSDAGAARGHSINLNRVKSTQDFYNQVAPYFRAIAWSNPMPKQRWQKTSAEAIAKFIQMFACDRSQFAQTIQYLQTYQPVR